MLYIYLIRSTHVGIDSVRDVCLYVSCQLQHINGQRLLQLDEAALKAIGVKNEYRRHSILYGIQELRDAEYSIPRTFDEFKVHTLPLYCEICQGTHVASIL